MKGICNHVDFDTVVSTDGHNEYLLLCVRCQSWGWIHWRDDRLVERRIKADEATEILARLLQVDRVYQRRAQ